MMPGHEAAKVAATLEDAIGQLADDVGRINKLGRSIGLPMIAIRFAGAPSVLTGENPFLSMLYRIQATEAHRQRAIINRIKADRVPERRAA